MLFRVLPAFLLFACAPMESGGSSHSLVDGPVEFQTIDDPSSRVVLLSEGLPVGTVAQRVEAARGIAYCADAPLAAERAFGICSGVLVAAEEVLTALHCVERCTDVLVWRGAIEEPSSEGVRCETVLRTDPERDLALIAVPGLGEELQPLQTTQTSGPLSLEGHPLGTSLRRTVVVAEPESDGLSIRGDILPGHSGAPLFDGERRLAGIVTRGPSALALDGDCLRPVQAETVDAFDIASNPVPILSGCAASETQSPTFYWFVAFAMWCRNRKSPSREGPCS